MDSPRVSACFSVQSPPFEGKQAGRFVYNLCRGEKCSAIERPKLLRCMYSARLLFRLCLSQLAKCDNHGRLRGTFCTTPSIQLLAAREKLSQDKTFLDIAKTGLNAVRIPFGHWVVSGPGRPKFWECFDQGNLIV